MSELVNYELSDGIARLTMQNGKVNAMSPALIKALEDALDRAEQDKVVVMLLGQPGIFSAGFDLKVMQQGFEGAELVIAGSQLCRRLLAFPYPIVAVCTGHAVAQGCFTLMACDYRVGVQGNFNLMLNESQIGMPMHSAGIEIARGRLARNYFNRCVTNAEIFDPESAVTAGFLDRVVGPEVLLETATNEAMRLRDLNSEAFRTTKLKSRVTLLKTLDQAIEQDRKMLQALSSQ